MLQHLCTVLSVFFWKIIKIFYMGHFWNFFPTPAAMTGMTWVFPVHQKSYKVQQLTKQNEAHREWGKLSPSWGSRRLSTGSEKFGPPDYTAVQSTERALKLYIVIQTANVQQWIRFWWEYCRSFVILQTSWQTLSKLILWIQIMHQNLRDNCPPPIISSHKPICVMLQTSLTTVYFLCKVLFLSERHESQNGPELYK